MKVSLIDFTGRGMAGGEADYAATVLIFTKSTRLNLNPGLFEEIWEWPYSKKLEELEYMANTIPSSWEFIDYTFSIEGVSRAFTHQFVRTRTNSYAQQSMRVTDMGDFDYITGPGINDQVGPDSGKAKQVYDAAMSNIQWFYHELIMSGVPIEDARGILPTNISTNIVAKINLRTLSDMARSRTGGRTQSEYRDVIGEMLDRVLEVHPWAHLFLFPKGRDFFDELEEFACSSFMTIAARNDLLKIIDKMRKKL